MQDIPLLWNQTGKKARDEDELRTEENRFLIQCNNNNNNKKERTLESGRLQSHIKLTEKKYIFIWLCNMVKQNST
jgi:hypothetical protein